MGDRVFPLRHHRREAGRWLTRPSPISSATAPHHTDAIVTADQAASARFPSPRSTPPSSSTTPRPSSPRCGEFGFGAEIGNRHGPDARARAGRRGAALLLQLPPARRRPDPALTGRMDLRPSDIALPPHARGLRIGLFGGSFNPAHAGHVLASRTALKRLGLDGRLVWLVTPGNPLKDNRSLPSLSERIGTARALHSMTPPSMSPASRRQASRPASHRRHAGQAQAPLPRRALRLADGGRQPHPVRPLARLAGDIAAMMPIAVIDRPGGHPQGCCAPAPPWRWPPPAWTRATAFSCLTQPPPAWVFLHWPRSHLSSTS